MRLVARRDDYNIRSDGSPVGSGYRCRFRPSFLDSDVPVRLSVLTFETSKGPLFFSEYFVFSPPSPLLPVGVSRGNARAST